MTEKTTSRNTKDSNQAGRNNQNRPKVTKMPLARVGKTETYTFEDEDHNKTEYKFFFPGLKNAQLIIDNARMGNGAISEAAYNQGLMEQVIVEPKTDWGYWNDNAGYAEVMDAADGFLGKWLHK